jgi:hypothetical protein
LREPYLGVAVKEWRRWWRRRPVKTVAVAQEVHGINGSGGGGDRQSRERRGLIEFWDEKRNDTGRATIYMFKTISNSSGLKPLLIVLESGLKQFWF